MNGICILSTKINWEPACSQSIPWRAVQSRAKQTASTLRTREETDIKCKIMAQRYLGSDEGQVEGVVRAS